MEKRRELRFRPNQPVALKVLDWPHKPAVTGCLLDVSGSGMRLRVPLPIPCGAPIRVDAERTISLGEVCRCTALGDSYEIGIQLSQTLVADNELNELNRALLNYRHSVLSRSRS